MAAKKKTGTSVANIQQEIARQAAQVTTSVGTSSGNRLRATQGKQFVGPDGVKVNGPINVVVLDFNSQNHYFPNAYDADNPEPPTCFAITEPASLGGRIDHMVPSSNAPEKQADTCNMCPMNQFGTDARGKGKACKNTRVLAVVSPDADDPAEAPILLLSVSPMALKGYDNYVRTLASKQQLPVSVITEVSFDEDIDYPVMIFRAVAMNGNLNEHWARQKEAQALLVAEPDLTPPDADKAPAPARKKAKKKAASRRRAA